MASKIIITLALAIAIVSVLANPDCSLKPEAGPCKASIQRFYYDVAAEQCNEFTYGGCQGNANNFETADECAAACKKTGGFCPMDVKKCSDGSFVSRDPLNKCEFATCPTCSLKPETGLCEAVFPRFYYDATDGACKKFTYGGCGGNENNFETAKECKAACATTVCAADTRECPSGSVLSRDPEDNCQFPACVCGGFENCVRYFDGCNRCSCESNGVEGCTRKACNRRRPAKCLKCGKGYSLNADTNECELGAVKPVVCTQEVKQCDDGSFVGRDSLNGCAFKPCP